MECDGVIRGDVLSDLHVLDTEYRDGSAVLAVCGACLCCIM